MGNKEMSEKTQKNFLFLFSFPFTPNFSFYLKYDRNFVLLIFRKKEEKAGKKRKSARGGRTDFPKQKKESRMY